MHRFLIPLLLISVQAAGQLTGPALIKKKMEAWSSTYFQEKVFVHTDQTCYLAGETLWFKIYVVNSKTHQLSDLSKVAYIEILDVNDKPVIQSKVEIAGGTGYGNLFIPASVNSGNYTFRCYTQWMRNFDASFFFVQPISLINTFVKIPTKESVNAPTSNIGFFPEGGRLVEGLTSKVGVQLLDADGESQTLRGAIVNQRNDTVARFSAIKSGMGSFLITPKADDRYSAFIRARDQKWKEVPFTSIEKSGVVMRVTDTLRNILVTVNTQAISKTDFLMAIHNRGDINYVGMLVAAPTGQALVSIDSLGIGLNTITLFDSNLNPLCERLYFRKQEGTLVKANVKTQTVKPRSLVEIEISKITSQKINSANLSLGVTKIGPLQHFASVSIDQYLLLSSDLVGPIQSVESCFEENSDARQALDALLLCRGWSRFTWKDVFDEKRASFEFPPEYRGHLVSGSILNSSNQPISGALTYLASPDKNIQVYPAISNSKGELIYEMNSFYGPRKIVVQTDYQLDSMYQLKINSPFSEKIPVYRKEPFSLSPATSNALLERSIDMQATSVFSNPDSVKIKPINTWDFYGTPDEIHRLDDYTRFPILEEVLREYVSGIWVRKRGNNFSFQVPDNINDRLMEEKPLVLLDGVPVFSINQLMEVDPLLIKEIDVITRKYYHNGTSASGIASFKTYKSDMAGYTLGRKALVLDYDGLQLKKEFRAPVYASSLAKASRVPDRRNTLLWVPQLSLERDRPTTLNFYSSDVKGTYRVIAQGLTESGQSVYTSVDFVVE